VVNKLVKINNGQLFKITSYDLQKLERKDHFNRNNPEFFTQLWWNFWSEENKINGYETRINPEIKISFVPKIDWFTKSRYWRDRYLVAFNISVNSLNPELNLSFKEKDQLKQFFENFNKEINEKFKDKKYFYWFDKWDN